MKVPFLDITEQHKSLNDEIISQISHVFERCDFIGGEAVESFEKDVASYLGANYAISCGNGTDALILALRACGVEPGDEVITTSFSFFATAEAVASIGAKPVFVDIKSSDYTINPNKIEEAITPRTKALLPVHIFGACCEMDAIMDIAHRYSLKVIEDTAQAIGAEYHGKKAGTIGDVGCFSFYPTKNLGGCGDGGMVTTNSSEIATIVKALREHGGGQNGALAHEYLCGVKHNLETNEQATSLYNPLKYYNYLIGYNSRLDTIQACILSIKLKYLDAYNALRAKHAEYYMSHLTDRVTLPAYLADTKPCWHQFVIRTNYKSELCSYLAKKGIGSGNFYPIPLHLQKAFNSTNCCNPGANLPNAEEVASQTVCLPIFPELKTEQLHYVIETVNQFFRRLSDNE